MKGRLPDNPIQRVQLAVRLLRERHRPLANWLDQGVQAHVDRAEELGRALGFAGALGRSPRHEVLLTKRNRLLRRALSELDDKLPALAREIGVYETAVPRAEKLRPEPAPAWSKARIYIHEACRLGLGVPTTREGLRKALGIPVATKGGDVQFLDGRGSSVNQKTKGLQ